MERCLDCDRPLRVSASRLVCLHCALAHAIEPEPATENPSRSPDARTVGDYELLEELGRGGMGVVYKARQKSLDRTVAIKMILAGRSAEDDFVTRFRGEAISAAALKHPNIVAVHEVGVHAGQHYFSMDYVSGRTLAELVREGPLPARRAAAYVRTMAIAMQHAHQHGIMHRDLKPSNVVIGPDDQPHITDFGLARQFTGASGVTMTGQVLGSVSYMPPEQAGAHGRRTGPQSDIYGLGATLYHLVTGRPPLVGEQVADTLQLVMTADPVAIRLLNPAVPVDLETICLKCLEKQPERRYLTAQALADDLDRFLRHEPIQARAVGSTGRLIRWCRRKPLVAGLGATVAASVILGFAGIAWQSRARQAAAAEARRQGSEARAQRAVAEGRLYAAKIKLAHSTCLAGKTGGAMDVLLAQVPPPGATDFRGFEWRYLYRLCQSRTSEVLGTNPAGYQSVAYSPDLRAVAFGTGDGFVELFKSGAGERVKRWHAHSGVVDRIAFLPGDSQQLVTISGDEGVLKLWNVVEQRVTLSSPVAKGMLVDLAISPSGHLWVTRSPDAQTVTMWEFERGSHGPPVLRQKRLLSYHGPAAFAPDGRTLALANRADGTTVVALLDVATGAIIELANQHADMIVTLAFSADGRWLATGGGDERIVIWDVRRGAPLHRLDTDMVVVTTVAFDGRRLFASGWEQSIRSWDPASSVIQRTWSGHAAGVNALAIAPDGRSMASAGRDGSARLWKLGDDAGATTRLEPARILLPRDVSSQQEQPAVGALAVSPDQQAVAAITLRTLTLVELSTGRIRGVASAEQAFGAGAGDFTAVAFSPDGRTIAAGNSLGSVVFLDAATLQATRAPVRLHTAQVWNIAFGLNGTVMATGGGFGSRVKLTDPARGGEVRKPIDGLPGAFPAQPITVSPDGRLLATGSPERRVQVWDLASGHLIASSPQNLRFLHSAAFSPAGDLLAYSDERGSIFLWDITGARPLRTLSVPDGPANTLAFSPDGRTLASGHMDHAIRLWNPAIDQEVAVLAGHHGWVWSVAFAQHGNALVSASRDGTVRLWSAATADEISNQGAPASTGR